MNPINIKQEISEITDFFQYKTIAKMNDHKFTLIKAIDRTLDFHSHDDSDEVFFILNGKMKIEFQDKIVDLKEGEMIVIPKGVIHRPICTTEVTCMLIEKEGTLKPDNTGGTYKE